ncbi:MAG: hypothetical protein HN509_07925 [Halobacteriovoraceae bacterium]|nr:hypothetical protein [Halobacteriovoraceae bacterium]
MANQIHPINVLLIFLISHLLIALVFERPKFASLELFAGISKLTNPSHLPHGLQD